MCASVDVVVSFVSWRSDCWKPMRRALAALVEVEVLSESLGVRVDVLAPTVQVLVKVVQVVLAATTGGVGGSSGLFLGKTFCPAVILSNAQKDVAIISL